MKENQANAGFSNLQLKIDNLQFVETAHFRSQIFNLKKCMRSAFGTRKQK